MPQLPEISFDGLRTVGTLFKVPLIALNNLVMDKGWVVTRFMMKSQVSQRDAGLDEQPLGVGPVSNKPVATLKPLLGPTSHYPFPPGVARQLVAGWLAEH